MDRLNANYGGYPLPSLQAGKNDGTATGPSPALSSPETLAVSDAAPAGGRGRFQSWSGHRLFCWTRDYEEIKRFPVQRHSFATEELSDEKIKLIANCHPRSGLRFTRSRC